MTPIFKPVFDKNGSIVNTKELKDKMLLHLSKHGIRCNLSNPQTIQDKLNYLSIYDVNNLKTLCADKLRVREYCIKKLGKDICIPLIASFKNTTEIKWKELPNSFVIKCNHGSGMNIIVKDKNKVNEIECKRKLEKWLNTDFSMQNNYELQYYNIPRRIVVEELLVDENQKDSLYDYKFWCFNGEPKLYTINNGHGHGDIMYYRMDDSECNLYGVKAHTDYKKPNNFDLMVEYTKKLSSDFKFVRVDFYEVNDKVYLGELTFTPGANIFKYKNPETNKMVGDMLKIMIKK